MRIDREWLAQIDHTLWAELVVVKLQNLNRWVHLRVQRTRNEFTAELGDTVVKKFKEERAFA